jgi:hypothetical protein
MEVKLHILNFITTCRKVVCFIFRLLYPHRQNPRLRGRHSQPICGSRDKSLCHTGIKL